MITLQECSQENIYIFSDSGCLASSEHSFPQLPDCCNWWFLAESHSRNCPPHKSLPRPWGQSISNDWPQRYKDLAPLPLRANQLLSTPWTGSAWLRHCSTPPSAQCYILYSPTGIDANGTSQCTFYMQISISAAVSLGKPAKDLSWSLKALKNI